MTNKNYYQLLGLDQAASEDDIKKAYRRLALKYHPDKNQDPGAEEMFKNISEAYEVLSDKDKKRVYDSYGVDGLKNNHHRHQRFNHGSNNFYHNSNFFHPRDPFDLFKSFFGSFDSFSHFRQNPRFSSNDPFENFFQNHSNLHKRFFNSPFHSEPNVFKFTPMFQKSGFDSPTQSSTTATSSSSEDRARKCSVETKTGQDGTVHITKTIVEEDGTVRREIRFRSPSANRSSQDDLFKGSPNLRREQTEPTMKYRNVFESSVNKPATFKINEKISEENSEDFPSKNKIKVKSKLETTPMKTDFSAFYSNKNKENRPVGSKSKIGKTSTDSFVGSKKPPKVSNLRGSKNISNNPRYLQATESSLRKTSQAEESENQSPEPKKSGNNLKSSHSRLVMCNLCYRNFGR